MSHVHQWAVTKYLLLSLPDVHGFSDRYTQWVCQDCPMLVDIDGNVRHGYPLQTPEFWDAADPASPTYTTRAARRIVRAQRR